jgi:protein arginine kinase
MNLDDLATQPGEWLRGDGPLSEIVISSRIRLARNLVGFPFLGKATATQRRELQRILRDRIKTLKVDDDVFYVEIDRSEELDRQLLVERHLISRQHAEGDGSRGVAVSGRETVALMVNEEDHLRIQVIRSGLQLDEAWQDINHIDDAIEEDVEYAFHEQYGYLTACLTNVGTGIRVSVMLHLPALKLTGELERVFRAAKDMRLAIRGLHGEGTEATGDFYQVSNQITLGRSEEIIDDFKNGVIPKIIEYETRARDLLVREKSSALDDRIFRALGALENARTVSSEETLFLLSHVRMGVNLGRLDSVDLKTVNDLFLMTQPAHLQKLRGERLTGEERSIARAEYIRQRLAGGGNNNNNN